MIGTATTSNGTYVLAIKDKYIYTHLIFTKPFGGLFCYYPHLGIKKPRYKVVFKKKERKKCSTSLSY